MGRGRSHTITQESVAVESVSYVAATRVTPYIVEAVLMALVSPCQTLILI